MIYHESNKKKAGVDMKFKWDKSYFGMGLTAFIVIACSILFYLLINRFDVIWDGINFVLQILMPMIAGMVIAYLLNPLLNFFEKTCFKRVQPQLKYSKIRRVLSVTSTILLVLLLLTGFFWLLIPQLIDSISGLVDQIPRYLNQAKEFTDQLLKDNPSLGEFFQIDVAGFFSSLQQVLNSIGDYLPAMQDILDGATKGAMSVVNSLMNIFVGFVVAIYLLYSKERFAGQSKKVLFALFPRNFTLKTIDILSQTDRMFSGYIFGKVVEAFCVAVLCFIGCTVLDIPYAIIITVIMFVFNLIPFFGPFIGAIPCTLLILLVDPLKALWFVILICVLQQFDGNVIGPMILGNHTGLTSFWIIFSIFLFGGLFGFVGMIIGVPTFAVIYSLVRALVEKRLRQKGMPVSTRDYMKMRHVVPEDSLVIVEETTKEMRKPRIFTKKQKGPAADKQPGEKETHTDTKQ
ncbi:MAG: AI-2E family transporter [Oscillospiraceae bacterium]